MAETGKTFLARKIAEATQAAIEFEQVIPANVVWAGGIPRPICGVEGSIGKATNVVVEALDTALDPYYKGITGEEQRDNRLITGLACSPARKTADGKGQVWQRHSDCEVQHDLSNVMGRAASCCEACHRD